MSTVIIGTIAVYGSALVTDTVGDLYTICTGNENPAQKICSSVYCAAFGSLCASLAALAIG